MWSASTQIYETIALHPHDSYRIEALATLMAAWTLSKRFSNRELQFYCIAIRCFEVVPRSRKPRTSLGSIFVYDKSCVRIV